MIRKLRLKFVAICMTLVTAILAVVFFSVYTSAHRQVEDLSRQVLHRVAQADRAFPGGFERPDLGIPIGDDRIPLPYFTVEVWGSRAIVTGGTYEELENTDALEQILAACLDQTEDEGELEDYAMRYLRQDMGLYTRMAFVDMSMERSLLRSMTEIWTLIALAALTLLLIVSVLLSYWATRPVEKAWKQQKQFLSDASHELKTPLTVILSNAELLETTELADRPARWADNIRTESVRMKHLVEEMLTLARSDDQRHAEAQAPVALSDVAGDCVLSFEPVAFEAGKLLQDDIAPDLWVMGDADKLRRLISVLLDNAIKYSPAGSAVSLSLRRTDRHARLTVTNSGEPIPAQHLPHLFERFYRADASRGEQSGFGLGLSIAAAIAEEHKATLKAESDAVSTRFILTIPLKK